MCHARYSYAEPHSFSFFLRDINTQYTIFVAAFGLAVVTEDDTRSYAEVAAVVRARGAVSIQHRIEIEPGETYEVACRHNIEQVSPIWLGLSRDMRFFSVGHDTQFGYWGFVQPRYHSTVQNLPESDGEPVQIGFIVRRGSACRVDITRRLEDRVLPLLRSVQRDDEIGYHLTAFATLETQPLSLENLRGTDYRAAYYEYGR